MYDYPRFYTYLIFKSSLCKVNKTLANSVDIGALRVSTESAYLIPSIKTLKRYPTSIIIHIFIPVYSMVLTTA